MKVLKFTLLISVLSSLLTFNAYADEPSLNQVTRLPRKEVASNQNPRTLPLLYMECSYCQGYISLEIPSDIEAVEVAIEDNSMVMWSGVLTPDFPESDIPYLSGEFLITCTTDAGDVYQGILVF